MPPDVGVNLIKKCAIATGMTASEITYIAGTGPKRYKVYDIPKRGGGSRTICQPSRELKVIQYFFLEHILKDCPVHPAAMAYEHGRSIRQNAELHALSRVVLKTDFSSFFPSIRLSHWIQYAREKFPAWDKTDLMFSALAMFWGAGTKNPVCLSIGAPTSPKLSNIMMYDFDEAMSIFAKSKGMIYTRYADDITISTDQFLDFDETMGFIRTTLRTLSYPKLLLNDKKTGLFSRSGSIRVTGLVLNNDNEVSLGRDRKRTISSLIHKRSLGLMSDDDAMKLSGLIAFARDVEPEFLLRMAAKYGPKIISDIEKHGGAA